MSPELAYRILTDSTAPVANAIATAGRGDADIARQRWLNAINQGNRQAEFAQRVAMMDRENVARSALQSQSDAAALDRAKEVQRMMDERSAQQRIRDALKVFNETGTPVPPRKAGQSLSEWADQLDAEAGDAAVKHRKSQTEEGAKRINTIEDQIDAASKAFAEAGVNIQNPSPAGMNLAMLNGIGDWVNALKSSGNFGSDSWMGGFFYSSLPTKFLKRFQETHDPDRAAAEIASAENRPDFLALWNEFKQKSAREAAIAEATKDPKISENPKLQGLRMELSRLLEQRNQLYRTVPAEAFNRAFDLRKAKADEAAKAAADAAKTDADGKQKADDFTIAPKRNLLGIPDSLVTDIADTEDKPAAASRSWGDALVGPSSIGEEAPKDFSALFTPAPILPMPEPAPTPAALSPLQRTISRIAWTGSGDRLTPEEKRALGILSGPQLPAWGDRPPANPDALYPGSGIGEPVNYPLNTNYFPSPLLAAPAPVLRSMQPMPPPGVIMQRNFAAPPVPMYHPYILTGNENIGGPGDW